MTTMSERGREVLTAMLDPTTTQGECRTAPALIPEEVERLALRRLPRPVDRRVRSILRRGLADPKGGRE